MSNVTKNTTLILVPGLFHGAIHFESFLKVIRNIYPNALAFDPPSYGGGLDYGLHYSGEALRELIEEHLNRGEEIILVPHSLGGVLSQQAINQSMTWVDRAKKGKKGGVVGIINLATFRIPVGKNLFNVFGAGLLKAEVKQDLMVYPLDPENRFYNAFTPDQQRHCVELLKPTPATTYTDVLQKDNSHLVPHTYLHPLNDQALKIGEQYYLMAESEKVGCRFIYKEEIDSDHTPFVLVPEETLNFICRSEEALRKDIGTGV